MKLMKRTILIMLVLLVLTAPTLSLAESDYEEGDGWVYQDGTLTITENNGLGDFINNEDPITQLPKYEHTVYDVTRVVIRGQQSWSLDRCSLRCGIFLRLIVLLQNTKWNVCVQQRPLLLWV